MSSLMHLVLVMCDASIVTVLLCLKFNLCQIITKNSFKMYTRDRDGVKKYQNMFSCCGEIVKCEEFSQRLCFDS